MDQLQVPQGDFTLQRVPVRAKEKLRAWDAADEYVLQHLSENSVELKNKKLLLLNDGFGALTVALSESEPVSVSDSFISQSSTKHNLKLNDLALDQVDLRSVLDTWAENVDVAIIKIPKTNALLEYQLHTLRPLLHSDSVVIAAGMAKHIHTSTLEIFESIIGATSTSLARKKARLAFVSLDEELSVPKNPYPVRYTLEGTEFQICNHANVFSREKLDIGTRFFLEHLPNDLGQKRVVDLGCGNGVVGLSVAARNPEAKLVFADESHMAVASARENFVSAFGEDREAEFHITNIVDGIASQSAELILNNPPFHQQHAVGDAVAWDMFHQSHRVLKTAGELYVIGNRHLGYHIKLKRLFGHCQTIASNRKFVILRTEKK